MPSTISTSKAREFLADLITEVAFKGERVILTRHGKPVAALISADDLELFEKLEDWNDIQAIKAAERENKKAGGGPIRWEVLKRGLKLAAKPKSSSK